MRKGRRETREDRSRDIRHTRARDGWRHYIAGTTGTLHHSLQLKGGKGGGLYRPPSTSLIYAVRGRNIHVQVSAEHENYARLPAFPKITIHRVCICASGRTLGWVPFALQPTITQKAACASPNNIM